MKTTIQTYTMDKLKLTTTAILLLFFLTQSAFSQSQKVDIPDDNFRAFLKETYPNCMDASDKLIVDSAKKVTGRLECKEREIVSIEGIQYFTAITDLNCSRNKIDSLPDLSNNLELVSLYCYTNKLKKVPDLSNHLKLQYFFCGLNELTELPQFAENGDLFEISCGNNLLKELPDLSGQTNLHVLGCEDNMLDSLPDLSKNIFLQSIVCSRNGMKNLNGLIGTSRIKRIDASENLLKEIPPIEFSSDLYNVNFRDNNLNSIPNFSKYQKLERLILISNRLDFSDCQELRCIDTLPLLTSFAYDDQKPFGKGDSINVLTADSIIFSIERQDSAISYKWFKDGVVVLNSPNDTVYKLYNVKLKDVGKYTCKTYGTALSNANMTHGTGINNFESAPFVVYDPNYVSSLYENYATRPENLVYPNPAEDIIYARDYQGLVRIFSTSGQLVMVKEVEPGEGIKIDQLQTGCYVVKLENESPQLLLKK